MFTLRVALPTFIQPYHPAPCSPMYRRRRRRSRYHSSRPIYTRTQAPCRQDRSTNNTIYQDTTLPSSDKSRQSVTLISGRSAINAFAIYPFLFLFFLFFLFSLRLDGVCPGALSCPRSEFGARKIVAQPSMHPFVLVLWAINDQATFGLWLSVA